MVITSMIQELLTAIHYIEYFLASKKERSFCTQDDAPLFVANSSKMLHSYPKLFFKSQNSENSKQMK